ncbi:MAG: FtsX-like permease family protein [Candidatus Limnocylindrales bacterium]
MSSFVAMIHVSLRRSRAAWPIVAAAGLICVLAATLLAAGPMYAGAVSIAGLHRVLADAPVEEANIAAAYRVAPDRADAVDAAITQELGRALGAVGGRVIRVGRSDTFELPGQPVGPLTDLVEIGFAEGIESQATMVDGSWPADLPAGVTASADEPVPVAVSEQVAQPLGLAVGQELRLPSRIQQAFVLPVRIVGIFRMDDPLARSWWAESQVVEGLVTSDRFATHGPFFTTRANLLRRATVTRSLLTWRALPEIDALTLETTDDLGAGVGRLKQRIETTAGITGVTVTTSLPDILARADRSLLVSRTGVIILTLQFVVLAAYAVLLSAALLVEHRRLDTAMLRSRGAGPTRIAAISLIEGLLLVVPAALAAPWIAAAALRAFNMGGPLADIGLRIEPVVSIDAYVAACVAALACLIALLLPALPRVRSFASVHGSLSRAETSAIGNRLGLDVALLAIAGLGLWQLRHYGAPLTRSVQGSLGIDPLLVATPAIGFLAGAIVALRLVPLLAGIVERITARGRGLVSSLGARQLARRPLRYTRAALLLMLAMAMGVFAITYTWTWSASQRDQADYQVGADVRAMPGRQVTSASRWTLDQTYAAMPGVADRMAVDRESIVVPGADRAGQLIGLDATTAAAVVHFRPDLAVAPLAELVEPLAVARPAPEVVILPGEPARLRLDVTLDIAELTAPGQDEVTGEPIDEVVDPATIADQSGLGTSVVVRDAAGQLYRFSGDDVTLASGLRTIEIPLGPEASSGTASFAYPLELASVEIAIGLPEAYEATDATVTVDRIETASVVDGTAWTDVPFGVARGWRVVGSVYGLPQRPVTASMPGNALEVRTGVDGLATVRGVDEFGRGTRLSFVPADITVVGERPVPAIATRPFLDATARAVGDELSVTIGGIRRTVLLVGEMQAFPTVDPAAPALVMDLPTLALLRFGGTGAVDPAEEWWLATDPIDREGTAARVRDPAIGSSVVLGADDRARDLAADPVALGVIGVLSIGVAAAALFAIVGFIASAAVAARERITEFALLRALGLSSGQLSGWLSLENATLALISLVAGTGLGLLVAWVALPFVTVTQDASAPYPPVEVSVPWATIALLEAAGVVALTVAVIGLSRLLRRVGLASALRSGED